MSLLPTIPRAVGSKLGHYVYLYVDPRTGVPFYVGKGRGTRAIAHIKSTEKKKLTTVIRRIRADGLEPRIEILSHSLPNEDAAFQIECAVIDALGLNNLANHVRGWRSTTLGRASLKELVARYTGKRVVIHEPTLLVRINQEYRRDMSAVELYDATRSAWRLGPRRDELRYAFAVYEGVVREVYEISCWLPAVSTFNQRWEGRRVRRTGRWEFVGTLAPDTVRARYVNSYVGHLFKRGNANPIGYAGGRRKINTDQTTRVSSRHLHGRSV
jgi:uncharacterized protein